MNEILLINTSFISRGKFNCNVRQKLFVGPVHGIKECHNYFCYASGHHHNSSFLDILGKQTPFENIYIFKL
jgi:hypothetical protein